MAFQITSVSIVYLTVCSGPDQRKHQSSASLAFVRGIHRWSVNFPHKGPVTRKMFPFDDVIMRSTYKIQKWEGLITMCITQLPVFHEILRTVSSVKTDLEERPLSQKTLHLISIFDFYQSKILHRSPQQNHGMTSHCKCQPDFSSIQRNLMVNRNADSANNGFWRHNWVPLYTERVFLFSFLWIQISSEKHFAKWTLFIQN